MMYFTILLLLLCLSQLHVVKGQMKCTLTSDDCKNKYCLMMESYFTCEVYGFGWEEICAEYIVGALFPCPIFPPADELIEAPSICLPNLLSLASLANPNTTLTLLPGENHTSDCYLECYQNYLFNALDFYDSCTDELDDLPDGMCPIITNPQLPLKTFQTYRAQTCSSNEVDFNCLQPIIDEFDPTATPDPDDQVLFDYSCPLPAENYEAIAQQMAANSCCFANQNAVMMSINQVYPPCFMNYMSNSAANPDATYFCVNGTLRDMGTVEVTLNMKFATGLPDMNDELSTQTFRGTLMAITGVNGTSPAQITVLKYTYYSDESQTVEVPTISGATSGVFTCLVMISSGDNSTWGAVRDAMASPAYGPAVCGAYQQDTSLCTSAVVEDDYFNAHPWDLSPAHSITPNVWLILLICATFLISYF